MLSDNEKAELGRFADNEKMFFAVMKSLRVSTAKKSLPSTLAGMEDKQIGSIIRAQVEASNMITDAFQELESYKTVDKKEKKIITGR